MSVHQETLTIEPAGPGLTEITSSIGRVVERSAVMRGVVTVFCQHTSCSLLLMENADPAARADLLRWFERLVPENDPHFTHVEEGPDDMPSHIKMALTHTSESIPFTRGKLQLGTWQGLFLWEHRRQKGARKVHVTVIGE